MRLENAYSKPESLRNRGILFDSSTYPNMLTMIEQDCELTRTMPLEQRRIRSNYFIGSLNLDQIKSKIQLGPIIVSKFAAFFKIFKISTYRFSSEC